MEAKARFFGQQPTDYASKTPYGNNAEAGHYVQAKDAKLYYELYGDKNNQPLLVLHGGGGFGCIYEMGQFIDKLIPNFYVIALSTRGVGKSEIGTEPVDYEQRANDAYTVIRDVTTKPVITLGFSDGAYTSYKLASMYPEAVKKIIALGAGENQIQLRKVMPIQLDEVSKLDSEFVKCLLSIMPQPERFQQHLNEIADTFYNKTLVASKELFGSIKCPVLLMSGEKDPNAPLMTMITAYNQIPNCQLAIIANARHQCMIDNFDACWTNMVKFLED